MVSNNIPISSCTSVSQDGTGSDRQLPEAAFIPHGHLCAYRAIPQLKNKSESSGIEHVSSVVILNIRNIDVFL